MGNYNKSIRGLAQIHIAYLWFEKCHFAHLSFELLAPHNHPQI